MDELGVRLDLDPFLRGRVVIERLPIHLALFDKRDQLLDGERSSGVLVAFLPDVVLLHRSLGQCRRAGLAFKLLLDGTGGGGLTGLGAESARGVPARGD